MCLLAAVFVGMRRGTQWGILVARSLPSSTVYDTRLGHDNGPMVVHADCFEWLTQQPPDSFHAIITDPPFGFHEYTEKELAKLRSGKGGVWRIPPSFDGVERRPLP